MHLELRLTLTAERMNTLIYRYAKGEREGDVETKRQASLVVNQIDIFSESDGRKKRTERRNS